MAIPEEIKSEITVEDIESLISEREDLTSWNNSRLDSERSKAVDSFMKNTMPTHINNAIVKAEESFKEKYSGAPKKTPAELKIEELQKEMEAIKNEKRMAELDSLITSEASKAKIPSKLLDVVKPSLLNASNTEECLEKLTDFKVIWGDVAKELVENDYKTNGTNPKKSAKGKMNEFDTAINNGDSKKALRALLGDI